MTFGPTGTRLELLKKTIVVSVGPDPKPGDLVAFQQPDRAVGERHADGVDRIAIVDLLEVTAGVTGSVASVAMTASSVWVMDRSIARGNDAASSRCMCLKPDLDDRARVAEGFRGAPPT